jgi:hypothetical protein
MWWITLGPLLIVLLTAAYLTGAAAGKKHQAELNEAKFQNSLDKELKAGKR